MIEHELQDGVAVRKQMSEKHTKSTHRCEVVRIKLENHPNADALSLVRVFGYQVCVRTKDWKDGQLAAYIVPDSVVPTTRSEFAFLARKGRFTERVRVKKLRGIISMGLLVPAPLGATEGDNVAEQLGVSRYEPPLPMTMGGDSVKGPEGWYPKYDVDSLLRYHSLMKEGEPVYYSEKIHGASAKYTYTNGEMFIGSRTRWKKPGCNTIWERALQYHPEIEIFCKADPGAVVLYGEVYGQVQNLKYGINSGVRFAAFDILYKGMWLNATDFLRTVSHYHIPTVPLLGINMPYSLEKTQELAEGKSLISTADHIREGVVVKPMTERTDPEIGRVCFKVVGNGYLMKC